MQTGDIIAELRDWADVEGAGSLANLLNEAADRLEELDAVCIIDGDKLGLAEKAFDEALKEIGVREA